MGLIDDLLLQPSLSRCALMPSIMGAMRLEESGWEAPLNAFRIDGSEQIDIVCLVVVCQEEKCPEANVLLWKISLRILRF